jgi:CubicO group peptidase (beta-lactamase class C family)
MDVSLDTLMAAARRRFAGLAKGGLPGAVVAVEHGGETRRLALGHADAEGVRPMPADALVRVGSVSKLVIAGVAARLAEAGALGWDTPLDRFLPDVPRAGEITLAMLGAHRTGLRDALEDPAFRAAINRDPAVPVPLDAVIAASLALEPAFAPGEGARYANINAILMAEALSVVAGRPWRALSAALVLDPAGSGLGPLGRLPRSAPRGYRFGARPGAVEYGNAFFDATRFDPAWAGPAGDLAGTIGDVLALGRFLRPRLASVEAPGATIRAPLYRRMAARWGDGGTGHAGDVPGYSAFLGWREGGPLVAVLANLSNLLDGRAPATEIAASVFDAAREGE